MIITLIIIAAVALVALGIFIAANNPAFAQRFKTKGTKLYEQVKEEARRMQEKVRS